MDIKTESFVSFLKCSVIGNIQYNKVLYYIIFIYYVFLK